MGMVEALTIRLLPEVLNVEPTAVRERTHDKKRDPHLLRIVKIVLVLLLQGGIQPVFGAKIRYPARDALTSSELGRKLGWLISTY